MSIGRDGPEGEDLVPCGGEPPRGSLQGGVDSLVNMAMMFALWQTLFLFVCIYAPMGWPGVRIGGTI